MKYIITLVLITLLCSGQIFSQENNRTIPSPYKGLIDKLSEIHHLNTNEPEDQNKMQINPPVLTNNKLIQVLKNLENKFYKTEQLDNENSRTLTTETLLGEGFLQLEYVYQTWDGTNWLNSSKNSNLYDARNNRVQSIYQNWNTATMVWENSTKYNYVFDANNNQTEYIYQNWSGGVWVNISRYSYTYDVNNNRTEQLGQSWSGSAWTNNYRYLYTYNANNKLTLRLYQNWNGTTWVNYSRYTSTYDANNNLIEQIYETWDGTVWVYQYKYISTFDINNNLIQQISQNWDGTTWVNSDKYNITYDANENPTEYLFQIWDVSVWKNSYKYIYIYDTNNNLIEGLSQSWDVSVWKNEQKFVAVYNTNNDPIEYLYQSWNVTVWENTNKSTLTYDTNNNNTEELYQTWNGTTWENSSKYLYTWAQETSIEVTSPNGGENWPVSTVRDITWTSSNVANVKLQYSTNNGTNWINITNVSASVGSYSWTIPNTTSSNCLVLISDVSNSLLSDTSDTVFTISPAVTPTITVSAPNGGENWEVGSAHSITWTSNNVTNVKIDYSTNNGTNWLTIASSTPSNGSYSWTIPNAPSTNCKVQISDVTNALINDQSNNVFTISVNTYPSTINLSTTYSFGDATKTNSYNIIGLPGANNLPITNILTGTPGASGDWRAFWDSGTGAYTEYSSGSTFNFTPGKAFWVISKNQINVNISNVNTVALASDNSYSIPLHSEWNLISNPFDKTLPWSSVQTENSGLTQPIYYFQNGSYANPSNFEIYKGYYFFNSGGLTTLKIPYTTTGPLPKNNVLNANELEIALTSNSILNASVSVGVSDGAKQGVDPLDIFSPPSQFCDIDISLYNYELETNYKYLQSDFRPEIGEGQEFNFVIKNISDQNLDMVISGLDDFSDYEIFLLDKKLSKLYDIKKLNSFEVKSGTTEKEYSLLIGTEEFILQKKLEVMPTEFGLYQNYPNPFNPSTRIKFSLPMQSDVSLKVYNILGELAADLINNQVYEAGYHEIMFDGSQLASGIYLYQIQTTSSGRQPFIEVKKMILIK